MTIRRRLLLSYLALAAFFTLGLVAIIDHFAVERLDATILDKASASLDRLADANAETARRILIGYGEELVALHARAAALEVARALSGREDLDDYARLRADTALRRIAIQDVVIGGRVVGYTSLLDLAGNAVIHPNRERVERIGYRPYRDLYPEMWHLVERSFTEPLVSGYYRFLDKESGRERDKYLVIVQVPQTPFTIDAVVFQDDFFQAMAAEVGAANDREKAISGAQLDAAIRQAGDDVKTLGLLLTLGLLGLGVLFAVYLAGTIARPITQLNDAVGDLGRGDFTLSLPERGPIETRDLARAFNRLGAALADHVAKLREETEARAAMASEIRLASTVQQALLPPPDAPARAHPSHALHAVLAPARECAGDFYDYFAIDAETLLIAIGDVSGKGMPAALVMAMTLILLRSHGVRHRDPGRVLALINETIGHNSESGTFVTLFLGYYSTRTGRLIYANAGHHAALLIRAEGPPLAFGRLRDPAIGFDETALFHKGEARVGMGETLLLYTDGVTEAQGPDGELFGSARFERLLDELRATPARALPGAILDHLIQYQQGVLYDDITLVALSRPLADAPAPVTAPRTH